MSGPAHNAAGRVLVVELLRSSLRLPGRAECARPGLAIAPDRAAQGNRCLEDCETSGRQLADRWGEPLRAKHRLPSLGRAGPRRRRRTVTPAADRTASRRNGSCGARGHGTGPSLRRPALWSPARSRSRSYVLAPLRALHLDRGS
jgi:hypothetical protein